MLESGRHGGVDKLYYLSRFYISNRELLSCFSIFERKQNNTGLWSGTTNYATLRNEGYIEGKRGKDESNLKYWRWDQ